MAPAFSSTRQAGAFAALLLILLLSPCLIPKSWLPPREEIYSSMSWTYGSYPYMCQQIFEEKGDIDIAFFGSSHMYRAIDTPYVQQQLSEKLGRPATVLSLCWNFPGFDNYYFVAKDLLEHRKVHTLVFYDDSTNTKPPNEPHIYSWRMVRYGADGAELTGLPLRNLVSYYYGSILGMPRNLLNSLRPNLAADASPEQFHLKNPQIAFPPDCLGTYTAESAADTAQGGYLERPDLFVNYTPQTTAMPSDVCVYSPETRDKFRFSNLPPAPLQTHFAEKFLSLAEEHSTQLVCLNLPILAQQRDETMTEGQLWINFFSAQVPLVGIVPARLFEGLDDDQVRELFEDRQHFNKNGKAYFARIITPKLIHLYEQANP